METPNSINTWARETFGTVTAYEAAVRANVELAELLSAVNNQASTELVAGECADVYIVVCQVPEILGKDLKSLMDDLLPPGPPELHSFQDAENITVAININMAFLLESLKLDPTGVRAVEIHLVHLIRELERLALFFGVDLSEEVNKKMQVNRQREWEKTDGGRFQHA